jgi:hypothetical protein
MSLGRTIGQLAKEVRVNIQTVRYYERRRLLAPTAKKASGYRLYGEEAVRRLRFIKNAQAFRVHTQGNCRVAWSSCYVDSLVVVLETGQGWLRAGKH